MSKALFEEDINITISTSVPLPTVISDVSVSHIDVIFVVTTPVTTFCRSQPVIERKSCRGKQPLHG